MLYLWLGCKLFIYFLMLRDKNNCGFTVAVITVVQVETASSEQVITVTEALGASGLRSTPEGNRETPLTPGS